MLVLLPKLGPFLAGRQEDASEVLLALIQVGAHCTERFHCVINFNQEMQVASFRSVRLTRTVTTEEENTTLLHQLFGCYQQYQNHCDKLECENKLSKIEYSFNLSLALEGRSSSIDELLQLHFLGEHIADWKCPICSHVGLTRVSVCY